MKGLGKNVKKYRTFDLYKAAIGLTVEHQGHKTMGYLYYPHIYLYTKLITIPDQYPCQLSTPYTLWFLKKLLGQDFTSQGHYSRAQIIVTK